MRSFWARARAMAWIAVCTLITLNIAKAADPIRVGMSVALTGGVAPIGKQVLTALQIWRDDVNAKGGLLGRPVELVVYDEQIAGFSTDGTFNAQGIETLKKSFIEMDLLKDVPPDNVLFTTQFVPVKAG